MIPGFLRKLQPPAALIACYQMDTTPTWLGAFKFPWDFLILGAQSQHPAAILVYVTSTEVAVKPRGCFHLAKVSWDFFKDRHFLIICRAPQISSASVCWVFCCGGGFARDSYRKKLGSNLEFVGLCWGRLQIPSISMAHEQAANLSLP